jgi:hypothetical protein
MDFLILIVRLTTRECQDLLLAGQLILLGHGVVDTTAIQTSPTGYPHLSICALEVKEVVFYHETLAA